MKRVRGPRSTRVVNAGGHLASATPCAEPLSPKSLAPAVARSALTVKPSCPTLTVDALSPFPSRTEGPRPALELLGGSPADSPRGWLPPSPPRQIPASQVPLRHPRGF